MDVRVFLCARSRRRNSSNTFPVAFFSVYPHAIVVIAETTKKNKNNKIRDVLPGQNSFLGSDSNLLIVFYVQIMPDDLVMQLHRF